MRHSICIESKKKLMSVMFKIYNKKDCFAHSFKIPMVLLPVTNLSEVGF